MNFLGLAHYRLLAIDEHEKSISLQAELTTSPSCCVHCQSALLYRHEVKHQPFADLPMRGKPVRLIIARCRYRCRSCNRTFFEDTPLMDEHHFITQRLADYIAHEALRRTFTSIADDVGLDEWTIRSIFREGTVHLTDHIIETPPRYLGIDEVYLLGKPRCVLTDVEQRVILDLLRNRDKASVKNYLQRLPASLRSQIIGVCMDMWQPYKQACNDVLPQATVIVDHFHVVKLANTCLDSVRKELRASLSETARRGLMHDRHILLRRLRDLNERQRLIFEAWTENFPILRAAHACKERFFDIWQADSRDQAQAEYRTWQRDLPDELVPAFQPLLTAMDNWYPEIMAYFDHRVSNGPTEALNGLLKLAQRMGRGYSFEAIRAKVLLTGGLRKELPSRPKIRLTQAHRDVSTSE